MRDKVGETMAIFIIKISYGDFYFTPVYCNEKIDEDDTDRYINSIYWAVITMITVGYGDISPQNSIEKVFVCLMSMLCCFVFAYALNHIGSIIEGLQSSGKIFIQ